MLTNSPHDQIEALLADHGRVAMATLVSAAGSTPKKAGAKMWVDDAGAIAGTVTIGGCVDARVIENASAVLEAGNGSRLLDMSLDDDDALEIGLTCGGSVQVLIESIDRDSTARAAYTAAARELGQARRVIVIAPLDEPANRLVIGDDGPLYGTLGDVALNEASRSIASTVFDARVSRVETLETPTGARHVFFEYLAPPRVVVIIGAVEVARSLVCFLRELALHTIVVDPRDRFLTPERFPDADELRAGIPSQIVASIRMSPAVAVVLVAHDYKYELPVLREVLRTDVAYIGMLGGRRRREGLRRALVDEGFTDAEIARVRSPIGLDIGARSTAEIALAIAAEIVAVERGAAAGIRPQGGM